MKLLNDFKKYISTLYFNDQIDNIFNIINDDKWSPLMNHGYKNLDDSPIINYDQEDVKWSNKINLYTHLFELCKKYNLNFKELNLLDVGCGFGYGTSLIKKYYNFKKVTGIDYKKNIIDHAKSKFKNVTFIEGSATELPFEDESFDMIVNVESLHHYKFTQYYYKEAYRVLKPGGYLLMCDAFIPYYEDYVAENFFERSGFYMADKINITPMVTRSCKDDQEFFKSRHPEISEEKINFYVNLAKTKYAMYKDNLNVFLSYIYYKM